MTPPIGTDWGLLFLAPIWNAIVALALLVLVLARREWLGRQLRRWGIPRIDLFGIGFDAERIAEQTADAYQERNLPPPEPDDLRAFGILSAQLAPLVRDHRLLWVDDQPQGNATEAKLLGRLGVEIEGATSTDGALARIASSPVPFDLVISDWDRGEGEDALDLIHRMREADLDIPIVVYTGTQTAERRAQAAAAGIVAVTTEPDDLLQHVLVELSLS